MINENRSNYEQELMIMQNQMNTYRGQLENQEQEYNAEIRKLTLRLKDADSKNVLLATEIDRLKQSVKASNCTANKANEKATRLGPLERKLKEMEQAIDEKDKQAALLKQQASQVIEY